MPFEASLSTISAVNGCYQIGVRYMNNNNANDQHLFLVLHRIMPTHSAVGSLLFIYIVAVLEFDDRDQRGLVTKEADNIPQRRAYNSKERNVGDFVSVHLVKNKVSATKARCYRGPKESVC